MYRLGCKEGTLNSCFTRADLDKIGEKLLKVTNVPDIQRLFDFQNNFF